MVSSLHDLCSYNPIAYNHPYIFSKREHCIVSGQRLPVRSRDLDGVYCRRHQSAVRIGHRNGGSVLEELRHRRQR